MDQTTMKGQQQGQVLPGLCPGDWSWPLWPVIPIYPILQTLILNRAPRETIDWADKVSSWDFQRIISCHFDSPVEADPGQFRQAFAFLENQPVDTLPKEDFELLRTIDQQLNRRGIIPPLLG